MNACIKSFALILLGLLGGLAAAELARQARAELTFASAAGQMEVLRQVRHLAPDSAEAAARIGQHWMKAFPPRYDLAAEAYRDAAEANPFDAYHWLDYARTSARLGNSCRAECALEMAEQVDPNSHEVQLDLGNIRLEMNNIERAANNHSRAIALNARLAGQLCPFYEASGWTPRQVAERLLSKNQGLLENYLMTCMGSAGPQVVVPLWEYVNSLSENLSDNAWKAYFHYLVEKMDYKAARALWGKIAKKYYGRDWDEGRELFWNRNLAQPFIFDGGLEWAIINPTPNGCEIDIDQNQVEERKVKGLRLTFDGTANISAQLVRKGLFLEPGQAYTLRCRARTRDITTDNGPYLTLTLGGAHPETIRSQMMVETGSRELTLNFTTHRDCGWAEIAILRDHCTRLNNKIKGEAWFGEFKLETNAPRARGEEARP